MSSLSAKPIFHINVLTVKPGRMDDFIAARLESASRLGNVPGLIESRLFRSEDESRVITMAHFDSIDTHNAFNNSAEFQAERSAILPLIERVDASYYSLVDERAPGR